MDSLPLLAVAAAAVIAIIMARMTARVHRDDAERRSKEKEAHDAKAKKRKR